ncbi:hypothetical protein [Nocardioides humi]|nr:hypothetical protein [Nocardioides humi]
MSRILLVSCLVLGLAACTGGDRTPAGPGGPGSPGPTAPYAFAAEAPGVPDGFREMRCPDLRGDGTGLTVRLVVPVATTGGQQSGNVCSYSHGYVRGVGVELGPDETLADYRAEELDPFEDIGGDDEVSDIAYRADAPGLDGRPAEELTYRVYNDGLPYRQVTVQSAGVRLGWSVPDERPRRLDAFDVVRRSVGVDAGTTSLCPSWGRPDRATLVFTPPPDVGWIERERGHCRIYVEGAPTVLEYGAVHPAPGPLEDLAARVRRDPEATRVRLRRGAGEIDGESADRLTWVVVRTEETETYEPPGTWRIVALQSPSARVEWGATPQWWRAHRSTYDDLVASVRVSPGPPSRP